MASRNVALKTLSDHHSTEIPTTTVNDSVESIIKDFIARVGYQPKPWVIDNRLVEAAYAEAKGSGIVVNDYIKLDVAIALAELTSHLSPFEVKVHITIYAWLTFLIDDHSCGTPIDLPLFPQRFYSNSPQPTPILTLYGQKLRDMFLYYDPITASHIIQSSLAFIDSCNLESRPEYQSMPRIKGGESWAYYFRTREGIADAFALSCMFPKAECPDITDFLQAMPDIGIFLNLGNDILSFYKEEKAGETRNYMHTRAQYEGKTS